MGDDLSRQQIIINDDTDYGQGQTANRQMSEIRLGSRAGSKQSQQRDTIKVSNRETSADNMRDHSVVHFSPHRLPLIHMKMWNTGNAHLSSVLFVHHNVRTQARLNGNICGLDVNFLTENKTLPLEKKTRHLSVCLSLCCYPNSLAHLSGPESLHLSFSLESPLSPLLLLS